MKNISEKYYKYAIYGLNVASEMRFDNLPHAEGHEDVTVRFGEAPKRIEDIVSEGVRYQARPGLFRLEIDNVAVFLIKEGKEIIIKKDKGVSNSEVQLFLLGSAFGALLQQQDKLTLHGGAIVIDHKAIVFSGVSGAGKSTLVNGFYKRGYPVIADDISVINISNNEKPKLYPGIPQIKLWENVLSYYKMPFTSLNKVRQGIRKYYYDVSGGFFKKSVPVSHVFILRVHNKGEYVLKKLQGVEKFTALKNNTYRFHFLKGLGKERIHFEHCTKTASKVSVTEIYRPMNPMNPDKLVNKILSFIEKDNIQ